jgi:hypothetical protein
MRLSLLFGVCYWPQKKEDFFPLQFLPGIHTRANYGHPKEQVMLTPKKLIQ